MVLVIPSGFEFRVGKSDRFLGKYVIWTMQAASGNLMLMATLLMSRELWATLRREKRKMSSTKRWRNSPVKFCFNWKIRNNLLKENYLWTPSVYSNFQHRSMWSVPATPTHLTSQPWAEPVPHYNYLVQSVYRNRSSISMRCGLQRDTVLLF